LIVKGEDLTVYDTKRLDHESGQIGFTTLVFGHDINILDFDFDLHPTPRKPLSISEIIHQNHTTSQQATRPKMRKSTLSTALLSLLPIPFTNAQTSSWGQPFTVDNAATSQQSLLPTSVPGIQSRVPSGSGVSVSLASTTPSAVGSSSATGSAPAVQSTGAAERARVGRKMGVAGVLAGAAGVLFV
jgi:hypothetical protein